jgi:serine/threonine protein kinase
MPLKCPACQSIYGESLEECPRDGSALEPVDPDDDPLVGQVVDERFRLDKLMGAGGMGRVYAGTQLSVDREVAIKLLRGEAVPDDQLERRFIREARVISGFSHPNIVRLIDFGTDPERGFPYLVMEMAGGVSLGRLLAEARLRPDFAVETARQVCSGLVEAHNNNIVHRDLKPDNLHILPVSDGSFRAKLLDFGIAFPQDATTQLTQTGMMCGTATYMSPEQARGHDVDGQADLYSLGIVLFEMLTGVLPFQGDSGFEIVMKHVDQSPPDLRQYVPPGTVPEALEGLIYDLLRKDARDRPAGADVVRGRLDAVGDQLDYPPIEVDANRSGPELFEPWLRPALPADAPIHSSDTLAGVESSPGTDSAADGRAPASQTPTGDDASDEVALAPTSARESPATGESDAPNDPETPEETRRGVGSEVDQQPPEPEAPVDKRDAAARETVPTGDSDDGVSSQLVVAAAVLAAVALLSVGGLGAYLIVKESGGSDDGADEQTTATAGVDTGTGSTPDDAAGVDETDASTRDASDEHEEADAGRPEDSAGSDRPSAVAQADDEESGSGGRPSETSEDRESGSAAETDDGESSGESAPETDQQATGASARVAGGEPSGSGGSDTPPPSDESSDGKPTADESSDDSFDTPTAEELTARKDEIVEKCRQAYRGIQKNSQKMQEISKQGDPEKTNEFAKKMKRENQKYSAQMQAAGNEFSALIRQAQASPELDAVDVQQWSREFSQACQGK